MARKTERYRVEGANSLWNIYDTVSFWKVMKCFIVIQIGRFTPFLRVKKLAVSHYIKNGYWSSIVVSFNGHARYNVP